MTSVGAILGRRFRAPSIIEPSITEAGCREPVSAGRWPFLVRWGHASRIEREKWPTWGMSRKVWRVYQRGFNRHLRGWEIHR